MRKAWGRWTGIVIGMSGIAVQPLHARAFPYIVLPGATAGATGAVGSVAGLTDIVLPRPTPPRPTVASNVLFIPSEPLKSPKAEPRLSNRALAIPAFDASRTGMFASIKDGVRSRGSSMTDVYLHGTYGFHLSAGSSYRVDYVAPDYGPGAAAGAAALMKLPFGAVQLRDGYESYAPVAMLGYDHPLTDRLRIGVEGGAMRGRAAAIYPVESMPTEIPPDRVGINPVGDLVVTYLF